MKNLERRWIYHYNKENNIYTITYILNTCDAIGLLSKFCKIGSSNPIAVQCYYKIKAFLDSIAIECYNIFSFFSKTIAIFHHPLVANITINITGHGGTPKHPIVSHNIPYLAFLKFRR